MRGPAAGQCMVGRTKAGAKKGAPRSGWTGAPSAHANSALAAESGAVAATPSAPAHGDAKRSLSRVWRWAATRGRKKGETGDGSRFSEGSPLGYPAASTQALVPEELQRPHMGACVSARVQTRAVHALTVQKAPISTSRPARSNTRRASNASSGYPSDAGHAADKGELAQEGRERSVMPTDGLRERLCSGRAGSQAQGSSHTIRARTRQPQASEATWNAGRGHSDTGGSGFSGEYPLTQSGQATSTGTPGSAEGGGRGGRREGACTLAQVAPHTTCFPTLL